MMSRLYAWEKLYVAISSLAAGTAPLRARLEFALIPGLLSIREEDFPTPELSEESVGIFV